MHTKWMLFLLGGRLSVADGNSPIHLHLNNTLKKRDVRIFKEMRGLCFTNQEK
jgi:hypothetical protein